MPADANDRYCDALRQLAEAHATTIAQYERTITLLEAELARSQHESASAEQVQSDSESSPLSF